MLYNKVKFNVRCFIRCDNAQQQTHITGNIMFYEEMKNV